MSNFPIRDANHHTLLGTSPVKRLEALPLLLLRVQCCCRQAQQLQEGSQAAHSRHGIHKHLQPQQETQQDTAQHTWSTAALRRDRVNATGAWH